MRCRACGATFAPLAWSALAMIERVEASEVQRVVSGCPEGTCVEVRHCGGCGCKVVAMCSRA